MIPLENCAHSSHRVVGVSSITEKAQQQKYHRHAEEPRITNVALIAKEVRIAKASCRGGLTFEVARIAEVAQTAAETKPRSQQSPE